MLVIALKILIVMAIIIPVNILCSLIIAENLVRIEESPIAASTQAIGASVSINLTITPAKYHAKVPYRIINTPPSVIFENITNRPTGARGTNICKSKKNDVHVVG